MTVVRRRFQVKSVAYVVVAALAIGGCAGLTSKTPPTTYDIFAAKIFPRYSGRTHGQLIITEPVALAVLDTEKIVVRPSPDMVTHMPDAQWEDRLPRLVQARILQSFENASRLRKVGRPGDRLAADFQLLIDIRKFEISAAGGTAEAEIAAKIVRERTGRILVARVFKASVPTVALEGPNAIDALNDAFARVATQLVLWASRRV